MKKQTARLGLGILVLFLISSEGSIAHGTSTADPTTNPTQTGLTPTTTVSTSQTTSSTSSTTNTTTVSAQSTMPASPLSVTSSTTSSGLTAEEQGVRDAVLKRIGFTSWPNHLTSPTIRAVDNDTWSLFTIAKNEMAPPTAFSYTVNRSSGGQFWLQTIKTLWKNNTGNWILQHKDEFDENGHSISSENRIYNPNFRLAEKTILTYTGNMPAKEVKTSYDVETGKSTSIVTKRYDLSGTLTSETRTRSEAGFRKAVTDYFNSQGEITKRIETWTYENTGKKHWTQITEFDVTHPEHSKNVHVLKKVSSTIYTADGVNISGTIVTFYSREIQQEGSFRYQAATVRYKTDYHQPSATKSAWYKTTYLPNGYQEKSYGHYYDTTSQKTGSYLEMNSIDGKKFLGRKLRQYHPGTVKTHILNHDVYNENSPGIMSTPLTGLL